MSHDALRRGRYSRRNQIYCITTVTRDRHLLFEDLITARLLIRELRRLHDSDDVTSLAWVVMPDHLHWLIQLSESPSLSGVVKTLKARSALSINRHRGQRGSLWQKAFYDRAIRKDEDIRGAARYIVANPLRAGLVENLRNYPHWDYTWIGSGDGVGVG